VRQSGRAATHTPSSTTARGALCGTPVDGGEVMLSRFRTQANANRRAVHGPGGSGDCLPTDINHPGPRPSSGRDCSSSEPERPATSPGGREHAVQGGAGACSVRLPTAARRSVLRRRLRFHERSAGSSHRADRGQDHPLIPGVVDRMKKDGTPERRQPPGDSGEDHPDRGDVDQGEQRR
jgi:hypothetical protein